MSLQQISSFGAVFAFFVVFAAWGPRLYALGPQPGTPGTITITDKKLDVAKVTSVKDLKSEQRGILKKGADELGWKVYLVAHLNRAPGSDEVNLVFYDQAPKPGQPREPVNAFAIHTKKDAKIMTAEVEIRPDEGFKPGGKYTVFITRLIGGKEEVYARTTLDLAQE